MKVVVIYAHPNPRSFNSAIAEVVKEELEKKNAEVRFKDLYAMKWNPVLNAGDFENIQKGTVSEDVKPEQADISWADTVIVICPVWWTSVPAILKGYIDRVFTYGFAYEYSATGPKGMLNGKNALLLTTSGSDKATDQQTGMVKLITNSFVYGVFGFSGFGRCEHKHLYAVPTASDDERKAMLSDIQQLIREF